MASRSLYFILSSSANRLPKGGFYGHFISGCSMPVAVIFLRAELLFQHFITYHYVLLTCCEGLFTQEIFISKFPFNILLEFQNKNVQCEKALGAIRTGLLPFPGQRS